MKNILALLMIMLTACSTTNRNTDLGYPIILNFISIGTGVPDAKPVEDFVKKFKTDNGIATVEALRKRPLGKEGEYELAFPLKELNKAQRKLFVADLSAVVKQIKHNGGSVAITLNSSEGRYPGNDRAVTEKIYY